MSRLIDADDPKLRGKLKFIREAEGQIYGRASWCFSAKCEAAIDDAKTVDAVPVVRCAVCTHFKCNMRGDGTLPKGVEEFECRNGRGGCDPMGFCDEGSGRTATMAEYDVDEKICKYYRKNGVTVKAEITGDLIRCHECKRQKVDCPMRYSGIDYPSDNSFCGWGKKKSG